MPRKTPIAIGTIRQCKDCPALYEHFGQEARRCRACYNAYNRRNHHKNAERISRNNRAKYLNNKRGLEELLKKCRCRVCREADPRTLRFYDQELKLKPMEDLIRRGEPMEIIKEFSNQCQVLCFNCRSKLPQARVSNSMLAVA